MAREGAADWTRPLSLVLLAGAAWLWRASIAGPKFIWLFWNLFLAFLPWLISAWLRRRRRSAGVFAAAFLAWLVLLPNAPYLITDLVHLKARPPVPLTVDVLFFAAFATAGVGLALFSLLAMENEVRERLGRRAALATVALVLPLCGWGVFLGRVQRWNSWDVLVRPAALVSQALEALRSSEPVAYSAGVATLLAAIYFAVRPRAPAR
jgi:uncharacterized membrane protein